MRLELKNIHKAYGQRVIFDNMSIDFSRPGFYLLSGKSGSGKTTLLNIIAGYEKFDSGKRDIEDVSMACIFQSYELIQELTVLENIRMGVDLQGNDFDESLLVKLGLKELENHYPNELSGGQKQRVGIARALYQNPNVIICDEPTESLDIDNKEVILSLLKDLSQDKVVIVACHELAYIEAYYDYHYEIQNCQLICKAERSKTVEKDSAKLEINYQKSALKHYIHRIIHRRTLTAVICFSVLLFVQLMLYALEIRLFTPKNSLEALNSHVVYVNLYNEDPDILKGMDIKVKPILTFKPIEIETRKYKVNVYPLENDAYELGANEIIINEQMLGLLGNESETSIVGKKIDLSYDVIGITQNIEMTVKGVVEEEDAYYAQIYYDYDAMMDQLKQSEGGYMYECFIEEATNYEVVFNNEGIERLYNSLSFNQNISVSHSIFDLRNQNKNQMSLYRILFLAIEVIALVTNIISIIYFNKKDSERNKTALSLMYSLQIPMKAIKWEYFKQKAAYMLISSIGIGIIILGTHVFVPELPLKTAYGFIALVVGIYLLSLGDQMIRFRNKDISMILKENKD